ncbi:GcrA family cell cycle regulator [Oecophyllibacter saccharovorans]|uniref:GcrA family cell cycle regulator n=1 Tax=Oecophyllibacter saccharovorans TaxID=2558360 RepID=UPI001174DB40|nr:GcrA family cell cycle regulator [Oecophyllibacter saccharovorans]TPW36432.1 GcrA cell cycle regulator [Oecophyllibacter saccharovorans]
MAMEWTEELIARLRDLWSQGLSTAEIGRQLAITKNAVVGKAHRLGLPPRPSPIRSKGTGTTRKKASRAKSGEAGEKASAPAQTDAGQPPQKTPKAPQAKKDAAASAAPAEAKAGKISAAPASADSAGARAQPQGAAPAPASTEQGPAPVASIPAPEAEPVQVPRDVKTSETAERPDASAAVAGAPRKVATSQNSTPRPKAEGRPAARRTTQARREPAERPVRQGPTCQWPNGDPGTPGFHFCGGPPLPGKPYCAEHAAIAYVKLRDRRDS